MGASFLHLGYKTRLPSLSMGLSLMTAVFSSSCAIYPATAPYQKLKHMLAPIHLELAYGFGYLSDPNRPSERSHQFSGGMSCPMTALPLFGYEKYLSAQVCCDRSTGQSVQDVGAGFRIPLFGKALVGLSLFAHPTRQAGALAIQRYGSSFEYLQAYLKVSSIWWERDSLEASQWFRRWKVELSPSLLLFSHCKPASLWLKKHDWSIDLEINAGSNVPCLAGFKMNLGKLFGVPVKFGLCFVPWSPSNATRANPLPWAIAFRFFTTSDRSSIYQLKDAKGFARARSDFFFTFSRRMNFVGNPSTPPCEDRKASQVSRFEPNASVIPHEVGSQSFNGNLAPAVPLHNERGQTQVRPHTEFLALEEDQQQGVLNRPRLLHSVSDSRISFYREDSSSTDTETPSPFNRCRSASTLCAHIPTTQLSIESIDLQVELLQERSGFGGEEKDVAQEESGSGLLDAPTPSTTDPYGPQSDCQQSPLMIHMPDTASPEPNRRINNPLYVSRFPLLTRCSPIMMERIARHCAGDSDEERMNGFVE